MWFTTFVVVLLLLVVSHNTDTNFYQQNKTIKDTFELQDMGVSIYYIDAI